jgi:hypothetical protein
MENPTKRIRFQVSTQALGKNLTPRTQSTHEGHKEKEFSTNNNRHLHNSG